MDRTNRAIYHGHVTYGYTLKEIADHLRVHYTTVTTVSRVLNNEDREI
jgi:transposase